VSFKKSSLVQTLEASQVPQEQELLQIMEEAKENLVHSLKNRLLSVVHFGSTVTSPVKYACDLDLLVIVESLHLDDPRGVKEAIRLEQELLPLLERTSLEGRNWYWSLLIMSRQRSESFSKLYLDMVDFSRVLFDPSRHFERRLGEMRHWMRACNAKKVGSGKGALWVFDRPFIEPSQ
jgi:hypothetical protein